MIRVTVYGKVLEYPEVQLRALKVNIIKLKPSEFIALKERCRVESSGYPTTRVKLFTGIIPKYEKRIREEEYNIQRRAIFPPITSALAPTQPQLAPLFSRHRKKVLRVPRLKSTTKQPSSQFMQ